MIGLGLIFFIGLPVKIRMVRIMVQPVQRVHVKIAGGKSEAPQIFATFEMPDGTEKEMHLADPRFYESLKINDTGMLIYRELKNDKDARHREFIWFEKDPHLDD